MNLPDKIKAIVLTCDRYRAITEHMIFQYDRLWQDHPFVFHVPYQELGGVDTERVKYLTAPSDIKATVLHLLAEIDDDSKLAEIVAELKPDFVIIALDRSDERPAICDYLLAHHPLIKVLAVAPEHDDSVFFWADIRSTAIESSEEGILNALRGKPTPRYQRII